MTHNLKMEATLAYYRFQRNLKRFVSRNAVLLIASLVILIPIDSSKGTDVALRTWDQILTGDCFEDIAAFDRTIRREENERIYLYSTFAGDTIDEELLMSIVVAVGPDGKRLDPHDWQKAFSAANDIEKAREFPKIGARAQVQAPAFSPDGTLSGIVFTTSDELFDVFVSVYEASSAAPRGSLTAENVARRIERAYRDTLQ